MLRELKTFMAVAAHGTFAAAGAHIGLTQSAVNANRQAISSRLPVSSLEVRQIPLIPRGLAVGTLGDAVRLRPK